MASSSSAQASRPNGQGVAQFQDILLRGPYAAGMRGIPKQHDHSDPDKRIIPVTWKCNQKKKDGHKCGTTNSMSHTKCKNCKGFSTHHLNVQRDHHGRPIQAGDDLNMVEGRLKAKYWQCGGCYTLQQIQAHTQVGSYCGDCLEDDEMHVTTSCSVSVDTWVFNKFKERLGTFNGMQLVELNPWMDNLWAVSNRINHDIAYTIVE